MRLLAGPSSALAAPSIHLLRSAAPLLSIDSAASVDGLRRDVLAAVARHGPTVESLLPEGPCPVVDIELLTGLLADLQLDRCQPLLAALPQGSVHGAAGSPADMPAMDDFVAEVATLAEANPHVRSMVERLPRIRAEDAAEVHRLVHYCLLLHLLTKALAADAPLAEVVFSELKATLRSDPFYRDRMSLFEYLKVTTVEWTLEKFVDHRKWRGPDGDASVGSPIAPSFGFIGLPFNILEAVLRDAGLGHAGNVRAGLALTTAPPGEPTAAPASVSTDAQRRVRIHLPLPEQWRDLYVSWNMAFTCTYGDSPYFASALLAPCVMGARPEEFLFHRTLALHLHASSHFFTRSRLQLGPQSRHVMARRDWRDARVTAQWGAINEVAAKGFERELARLKLRREAASAAEGERLRQLEQLRWAASPLLHPLSVGELRRRLARPGRGLIPPEDVRWAGTLLWAAPSALKRVITDRWEAADQTLYPRPAERAAFVGRVAKVPAKVSMQVRK